MNPCSAMARNVSATTSGSSSDAEYHMAGTKASGSSIGSRMRLTRRASTASTVPENRQVTMARTTTPPGRIQASSTGSCGYAYCSWRSPGPVANRLARCSRYARLRLMNPAWSAQPTPADERHREHQAKRAVAEGPQRPLTERPLGLGPKQRQDRAARRGH